MSRTIINIWGNWTKSRDIKPHVLEDLIKVWRRKYSDIEFNIKSYKSISKEDKQNLPPEMRKHAHGHCFTFFIENQLTSKYMLISWWDRASDVVHDFKQYDYDENCVEFFTGQGCHNPKKTLTPAVSYTTGELIRYTPLNKIPWGVNHGEEIERALDDPRLTPVIPDKLHIRMFKTGYGFRTYLIGDDRFITHTGGKTKPGPHVQELAMCKINLEVYSVSGPSMRLLEGFGLGTAVLSTSFPQKTHDEIIPDFHFVKVPFDHDHYPFHPGYSSQNYSGLITDISLNNIFKELADSYIETFEAIKKDPDRIDYISKNAREYYLNHCTREKYTQHLEQMLDLKKIL